MFCRHCGQPYQTDQAVVCVSCGAPKGAGNNFCPNCGKPTPPNATVCMSCGVAVEDMGVKSTKSKMTAGLFGIFLGMYGVHNFYLGYTTKAIIQLVGTIIGILTVCIIVGYVILAGIWIWSLIEGIMILCGKIDRDATGKLLKD